MTIGAHATAFAGRPVEDFAPGTGLRDPAGVAYRVSVEYDAFHDGTTLADVLDALLLDPLAARLEALVVGPWEFGSHTDSTAIVEALVAARERLPALAAV